MISNYANNLNFEKSKAQLVHLEDLCAGPLDLSLTILVLDTGSIKVKADVDVISLSFLYLIHIV